jgi:hypothetical protein
MQPVQKAPANPKTTIIPTKKAGLNRYLKALAANEFYGTVEIKFLEGKVALVSTTKTMKFASL